MAGGASLLWAATAPARLSARERAPNFVIFVTDDQRWDALGVAGNKIIRTPNIDAIARQGLIFSRAYVTTSICPTSRTSILTGQYARRHGIWDFKQKISDELFAQTYPTVLRSAGYFTGFVGKYGVGPSYPDDKFDFIRSFNGQGKYELRTPGGGFQHMTAANGNDAIEFLRWRDLGKPFCLSVSFKAPHAQDGDPRQFVYDPADQQLYATDEIPFPPGYDPDGYEKFPEFFKFKNEARRRWQIRFSRPELFQEMVKSYYRLITGVDREVGRIVNEIQNQGLLQSTVVLFTSDNGFYLGEHGLAGKWFGHEPSIRVPLILTDFRRPSIVGPNVVDHVALNIDIAPTIISLAGAPPAPGMQGRDLSQFVERPIPAEWRQDFLYEHLLEYPGIPKSEGTIGRRFKYLRYWRGADIYEELFDLQKDPFELRNLAAKSQSDGLLPRMRERLGQLIREAR